LREKSAIANYALMGGGSPIVPQTQAQADALRDAVARRLPEDAVRAFVAMRYWHPFTEEAAKAVKAFAPDEVILTPLYPQYSTTTTGSSLAAWRKAYKGPGEVRSVCCYYDNEGLIDAQAWQILKTWEDAGRPKVRLLFSAHGLPEKIVADGDPYQWQIEATCAAVAARLGEGWDWQVCYQSRVGPLRWLGPSTPQAIEAAAADGVGVLINPVAFVSEHIETLVELDREYAEMAHERGIEVYLRAPVVGVETAFVEGLATAVVGALGKAGVCPYGASCPAAFARCGRSSRDHNDTGGRQ
jgi:ferrochelatase